MSDTLASMESSHSIYINRLATHEANKLNQFWGSYLRMLQNALAGYDSDITQRQLNKLIREVDELIGANMGDWQEQFLLNMDDLAEYEADFQAAAIGAITGNDLAVPATQQVVSAALSNPISMGSAGAVDLMAWLANVTSSQKQRIESEIKLGYANGVGNQELVRRIVGTRSNKFTDGIADIDRRSAVTLVRTTTNHYASVARRKVYEENKDVVIGHRWVSTLDGRTSVICRGRDGEEYLYDDGKVEYPPAHPNCLLGDTNVTTSSSISNVYKRTYKGVMIDIITANNRKITITPNHPVLTTRGWVAAGEINSSDKVVTMNELSLGDDNKYSVNASFEQIFSALYVSINPRFIATRPTSTEHFHGDGVINEDVNVINTNSLGWYAIKSIIDKKVVNDRFKLRESVKLSLNGFGSLFSFLNSCLSSSGCFMSSFCEFGNLLRSGSFNSRELLLASVSESFVSGLQEPNDWRIAAIKAEMLMNSVGADARLVCFNNGFLSSVVKLFDFCVSYNNPIAMEMPGNCLRATAEELPDLIAGELIDGVELDDVVSVRFREVDSTHVYNLENNVNWYLSNGIVTHNCRSTTSPIVKGYNSRNPQGQRASRGGKLVDGELKSDPKPVSATEDYYEWLKKQPAEFQDNVLGKTKGKIFRNSGISVGKFKSLLLDEMQRPLTIKEMAEKDKKIASYLAGL